MRTEPQVIEPFGGPSYDWASDHILVKTTSDLTDGRLAMVEDTLKPGFRLARHFHKVMTEIFYVLDGEATFTFAGETVVAARGAVVNIPPHVIHEVTSDQGARLITVFSPGGFEAYLAEMATMSEEQFADEALMRTLGEKYDNWIA